MTDNVRIILKNVTEQAGLTVFEDYDSVDTLEYASECLGFISIKEYGVSRWVRAVDCKSYGTEISGHACIRILGTRGNYSDYGLVNNHADLLMRKLGLLSQLLITSASREEISENRALGRLECRIFIDYKTLMINNTLQEVT
ncbi:MAG: hypothetical protein ACI4I7_04190 [Oscillospiraceae bacterium]